MAAENVDKIVGRIENRLKDLHKSDNQRSEEKHIHRFERSYRTELCREYQNSGTCRFGDECRFAHSIEQLRFRPLPRNYKTKLCRNFEENGFCKHGAKCHFIHRSPILTPADWSAFLQDFAFLQQILPSAAWRRYGVLMNTSAVNNRHNQCVLPKWSVRTAASMAFLSLASVLVGVPLMLNDMTQLENDVSHQRKIYMDLSNKMWKSVMEQNEVIRMERSADSIRQRRQDETSTTTAAPKTLCPQGPKGNPGEAGEPGSDGDAGVPGSPGSSPSAAAAPPAESPYGGGGGGQSCGKCPAGPAGLPGYKGKRGTRGEKGPKGSPGVAGRDGQPGDEGPEGEIGLPGDIGDNGPKGTPGEDGIGYAKGTPGPKGESGAPGMVGDEGPPGERGDDSPPGLQGGMGPPGRPGEKGKDGTPGQTGQQGSPGADAEYCPCPERSKGAEEGTPPAPATSTVPAYPIINAKHYDGNNSSKNDDSPPLLEHSVASRRFAAYSKLAHSATLRRRHLPQLK
uniref:C3H1-type domain-containing protein n=1 Tax=Globodera rostochiensis TaxID=31243 RepID=A0A914HGJ6_GLORO